MKKTSVTFIESPAEPPLGLSHYQRYMRKLGAKWRSAEAKRLRELRRVDPKSARTNFALRRIVRKNAEVLMKELFGL